MLLCCPQPGTLRRTLEDSELQPIAPLQQERLCLGCAWASSLLV